MATLTAEQRATVVEVIRAIADAIRELGEVPSGHLYARVMGTLDIHSYNNVITLLKGMGWIEESNHLIRWIGPKE